MTTYTVVENTMAITKITVSNDDGTTADFFPVTQSVTDTEVKIEKSDGTEQVFKPE